MNERVCAEKTKAVGIAPKHNNSLRTFPYAIQKHLVMLQSDLHANTQSKNLKDQCKCFSKEVKKTTKSTKQ